MDNQERILVIKLSALGDFIQALGPMQAIRKHHPDAHITLLTTKAYVSFGEECGYFNDVWVDEKPKFFNFGGWVNLSRRLNQSDLSRVYDLQNNDRSRIYFKLFTGANRPEWVGTAKGGSHYNASHERTKSTAFAGHCQTLGLAGVKDIEIDNLNWIKADVSALGLKPPYALFAAGCAPSRPEKLWPTENFIQVAKRLAEKGIQPVLLGTKPEKKINGQIKDACPEALDLTDKTNIKQIAALGRDAKLCIANDTGPAHIISVTGCPCYVAFSTKGSNPDKHAPLGQSVEKFIADDISGIAAETIWQAIDKNLGA